MRRKYTIAAAALLLVGAPAQAERAERDPDKMAVIAATKFLTSTVPIEVAASIDA